MYVLCPFQSLSGSSNKLTILSFLARHFFPLILFLNRSIMTISSVIRLGPTRIWKASCRLYFFFLIILLLMTSMIDNCPS
ncbi:hypothetical protein EV426DRAFT_36798 [Tirmania nivea]|nr:hypothetical protein EV426DRAFT_36798 [Tirmania nivea]